MKKTKKTTIYYLAYAFNALFILSVFGLCILSALTTYFKYY
ncbi:hypothetical protein Lederberg_27 [Pelagibacter phage Lederberg EXVC029P]|nr:hypothetical protein Lederberg_27 [Pelagibacter phage Lederberg EXVC029P]